MTVFSGKLLTRLWSLPGLIAFILYLFVTVAVVTGLFYDAAHALWTRTSVNIVGIAGHTVNSVLIGLPSAAACVAAGMYLAYRLRFVATRHAILAVIVLLTPYFSSSVGLYVGLKSLFGPSPFAFAAGLVIRYLPICTIVLLLALQAMPAGIRRAARNLQVSRMKLFWRVVVPVMWPTSVLLLLFLTFLMPLDIIGSTVGGGGQLQTFGNLIADYARTRDAQSTASLLTAVFILVSSAILFSFMRFATQRGERSYRVSSADSLPVEPIRTVYLNPVFLLFVCLHAVILITLLRQRPEVGTELSALWSAFGNSAAIIAPISIISCIFALFVGCWLHLADLRAAPARERSVLAALVIPTLLPPILAGQIGAVTQGLLNISGDTLTVAVWYVYFFGAVPILVVVSHPLIAENVLAHVAANHRVNGSDYVLEVLIPTLRTALFVGLCLFGAIAMSDAVIVRYVGGFTKTLGLLLADHQAGVLSPGDYVFLGGLGLWTLGALLFAGAMLYVSQHAAYIRVGRRPPTSAIRRS